MWQITLCAHFCSCLPCRTGAHNMVRFGWVLSHCFDIHFIFSRDHRTAPAAGRNVIQETQCIILVKNTQHSALRPCDVEQVMLLHSLANNSSGSYLGQNVLLFTSTTVSWLSVLLSGGQWWPMPSKGKTSHIQWSWRNTTWKHLTAWKKFPIRRRNTQETIVKMDVLKNVMMSNLSQDFQAPIS